MKAQVCLSHPKSGFLSTTQNIYVELWIRKGMLIVTTLLFLNLFCTAQESFQKKVISVTPIDNSLDVVYSNEFKTNTYVIRNFYGLDQYTGYSGLTMFDSNTGIANKSKSFSSPGTDIIINNAYSENGIIYLSVNINNAIEYTSGIIKYDMTSNSILWAKKIKIQGNSFIIKGIVGDSLNHLYILGNYYSSKNTNNDLFITKMNINGNIVWSKTIAEPNWDEIPSTINYNGVREIYLTSVGFEGVFGRTTTIRIDSSGNILNTIAFATNSGPRFSQSFSTLLTGNLYQIDKTVIGPSDPGPILVRKIDSTFNIKSSIIISGLDPRNVASNKGTILITGQAPLSSGFKGFRTMRFDSNLNVEASRYFNKINTYSIATSATSFINSTNNSFHFFKVSGTDTLFFIKTDTLEITDCQDTSFAPSTTVFNYSQIPFNGVIDTISLKLINLPVQLNDFPFTSIEGCETETSISETNNKDIKIYPIPAYNFINIALQNTDNLSLEVINALGQSLIKVKRDNNKLDISKLPKGFYVLKITNDELITTRKFIKN